MPALEPRILVLCVFSPIDFLSGEPVKVELMIGYAVNKLAQLRIDLSKID
jgi:hypothetical protein